MPGLSGESRTLSMTSSGVAHPVRQPLCRRSPGLHERYSAIPELTVIGSRRRVANFHDSTGTPWDLSPPFTNTSCDRAQALIGLGARVCRRQRARIARAGAAPPPRCARRPARRSGDKAIGCSAKRTQGAIVSLHLHALRVSAMVESCRRAGHSGALPLSTGGVQPGS